MCAEGVCRNFGIERCGFKTKEDMMDTIKHHEKPGIDYVMILIPVIYWVIFILEAVSGK